MRNHSPSGVEWGYSGSGPSQPALAVLLAVTDRETAERRYQEFKCDVIARISDAEWSLPLRAVRSWLQRAAAAEAAH